MSPESVRVEVDGRQLKLTSLGKVLYPATGFTKGEVLDYYARVADVMVPHLTGRPVTLKRFPDGVEAPSFFEKHVPAHAPEWVRRVSVPRGTTSRSAGEGAIDYAVISDRPSLIWAANLAALELHVPQWRIGDDTGLPDPPDLLVFDLDPGPGTTVVECCTVASWLADEIGRDGVVAKTSGSKGLQLYLGLRSDAVDPRELAHELARKLERDRPEAVVSNMKRSLRAGKVLIDWSQNSPAKTTVAAYSLRAMDRPTVSTPVSWDEVDGCARSGRPEDLEFVAPEVLDRIEREGDLFAVPG